MREPRVVLSLNQLESMGVHVEQDGDDLILTCPHIEGDGGHGKYLIQNLIRQTVITWVTTLACFR